MKKLICSLLALLLSVSLVACTTPDEPYGETSGNADQPAGSNNGIGQNENENYSYSNIQISSGGASIRPISVMVYVDEYKGDQVMTGDGMMADGFFINVQPDHTTFPTLKLGDTLTAALPDSVSLVEDLVVVYDTDFEQITVLDTLEELTSQLAGEYVVVIRETIDTRNGDLSATDYTLTCNDCIFKLIIE